MLRVGRAKPLIASSAVGAMAVLLGLTTVLALNLMRPAVIAFALGGLVLLLPMFVVKDERAYWLFLLVVSVPFEVSKRTTTWLVEPWTLFDEFGLPASGTFSLDLYVTDVILLAMLAPWLARLCLHRDRLYFPKVAYIFVLYLAWALIVSLIQAESLYLALFEWCRELLYFISFIYLINNVVTSHQFRAVLLALFAGLAIEAATVLVFFHLGIGTETKVYSGVYRTGVERSSPESTLYEGQSGSAAQVKRSAGTFVHPGHAAYYFEYTLLLALAYTLAAPRLHDRALAGALFAVGAGALYLTFSRAGMIGFAFGIVVFFFLARWSRLVSQRAFAACVVIFILCAAAGTPLVIESLYARPESVSARWRLIETGLAAFEREPILGAGLNYSSSVMEGARAVVATAHGKQVQSLVVHNYYLIMLIAVGIVGFFLFFGFFWQVVAIAVRSMRLVETEMKLLLVGAVAALASVAVHNFGDPFGGHAIQAMLWLYAGMIVAIGRFIRGESRLLTATRPAAPDRPLPLSAPAPGS